ncbi:CueP family metal-binding protein [Arthrobacter psychrochitiniphilus]|uniref:CueP family metal-binding protein n=1 Tax=Arthrobacter psychrochitiniphilus TaxID=291045 RepID=UPI003F7BAE14
MNQKITRRASLSGAIAMAAASMLLLAGCSTPAPTPSAASAPPSAGAELITELGFDGKSAKDIITELDTLPVAERSSELMASIRPEALTLRDAANREATLPMPANEFYVSVAPYVSQTHECHFHSLTTCLGELANQEVEVTVTNDATGEVLIQEALHTYDNGFLGLWLPRGIEATLTLNQGGKSATQVLSTKNADDPTCVTTTQLS